MGVLGLWNLVEESGTRVNIETLQGKVLAVDLSIWINQAIKGFRDKDGKALENAHILGLFHRICKLLFYGVKPIFVFDGEAPILKQRTAAKRRDKTQKSLDKAKNMQLTILEKYALSQYNVPEGSQKATKERIIQATSSKSPKKARPNDVYEEFVEMLKDFQNKIDDYGSGDSDDEAIESDKESMGKELSDCPAYSFPMGDCQNIRNIDIKSEEFLSLTAVSRYEVLKEMRESYKGRKNPFPEKLPTDSDEFSSFQMAKLLKKRSLQDEIDKVIDELNGHQESDSKEWLQGLQFVEENMERMLSGKLASDEKTKFLYLKKMISSGKFGKETLNDSLTSKDEPSAAEVKEEGEDSQDSQEAFQLPNKLLDQGDDLTGVQRIEHLSQLRGSQPKGENFNSTKLMSQLEQNLNKVTNKATTSGSSLNSQKSTVKLSDDEESSEDDEADLIEVEEYDLETELLKDPPQSSKEGKATNGTIFEELTLPYDTNYSMTIEVEDNNQESVAKRPVIAVGLDKEVKDNDKYSSSQLSYPSPSTSLAPVNENKNQASVSAKHGNSSMEFSREGSRIIAAINRVGTSIEILVDEHGEKEEDMKEKKKEKETIQKEKSEENKTNVDKGEHGGKDNEMEIYSGLEAKPGTETEKKDGDKVEEVMEIQQEVSKIDTGKESKSQETEIEKNEEEEKKKRDEKEKKKEEKTKHNKPVIAEPIDVEKLLQDSKDANKIARQAMSVSHQMLHDCQRLLILFGCPFLVSPSEAEAQCATLENLGLCEGVITDDSDIFLFGGQTVYKNFFSNDKFITQFRADDLERYYGLNRAKLICLGMMCGTDYTVGIDGIGPVNGLEIIAEFSGKNSKGLEPLEEYAAWYRLRKTMKNTPPENKIRSKLLRFKLPESFPSKVVYDAYWNANTDQSTEKFSWSMPQLQELRNFTLLNFGWSLAKADALLLPVIQNLNKKQTQKRIEMFFPTVSRNATVNEKLKINRSKRLNAAIQQSLTVSNKESGKKSAKSSLKKSSKNSSKKSANNLPKKSPTKKRKEEELQLSESSSGED